MSEEQKERVELLGDRRTCREILLKTKSERIVSRLDRAIDIGDHAFIKKLKYYITRERKGQGKGICWRWTEFKGVPIGSGFFKYLESLGLTTYDSIYRLVKSERVSLDHTDFFVYEDLTIIQKRTVGKMLSILQFVQLSSSPSGKRTWVRLKNASDLSNEIQEFVDEIQASLGVIADEDRKNLEIDFNNIL